MSKYTTGEIAKLCGVTEERTEEQSHILARIHRGHSRIYGRREEPEKNALDDDPERNPGYSAAMVFHHFLGCQRYLAAVCSLGNSGCCLGNICQQVLFQTREIHLPGM